MPAGLSKATWGQAAAGLSPSQVDKLRTDMAQATGINQAGRCRTMAILIGFGLRQDPKVKLLRDTANMWIDLWRDHPGLRADMRFAWRQAHAAIVTGSGKVQWHRVTGPVSATIASLTSQGWTVTTPEVWQDPHGDRWNIGNDGTKAEVEALIQAITAKQL